MTVVAISVVDEAVGSIDRLVANLKKDSARQVRSSAERSLIKATAHAWFHSHRSRLESGCDRALLEAVGASFTTVLELADRNTTRTRHLAELSGIRRKLIALRSASLQAPTTTNVSAVVTEQIKRLATPSSIQDAGARNLVSTIHAFVRMYRPHESREDTVLFPALRQVVSHKEFDELGEHFEDKEHELFGKEGFEGIVEQVANLERELGIYDLNLFTPT